MVMIHIQNASTPTLPKANSFKLCKYQNPDPNSQTGILLLTLVLTFLLDCYNYSSLYLSPYTKD
mgnify:CR=1